MKHLIVIVSPNKVNYVFCSNTQSTLEIIKDSNLRRVKKDDYGDICSFDEDVCIDFAEQMLDKNVLFSPSDFVKLSGGEFAKYSICVIDNR